MKPNPAAERGKKEEKKEEQLSFKPRLSLSDQTLRNAQFVFPPFSLSLETAVRWKHQAHFAWIVCPIEHMTPASPNTKAFCAYNKIHSFTHLQIYQYHLIPKISSLGI
ncbi:hypothetical protein AAC387_Pa06g0629 [Persea americana]